MITAAQQAALASFYAGALAAGHVFPEAAACEAVVETTWGTSALFRRANNIFGMKQHVHPVYGTVNVPTREFEHGAWVTLHADFVSYPDLPSCFRDRMLTLTTLAPSYPHYEAALRASSPEQYLTEVSRTWSTGPTRAQDCIEILHAHADVFRKPDGAA